MTWAQLGRHTKPMVFANINGFWDPLNALLGHMTGEGFIHTAHLVRPMVIDTADKNRAGHPGPGGRRHP